jgi:hypothetical protein
MISLTIGPAILKDGCFYLLLQKGRYRHPVTAALASSCESKATFIFQI